MFVDFYFNHPVLYFSFVFFIALFVGIIGARLLHCVAFGFPFFPNFKHDLSKNKNRSNKKN